MPQQPSLSTLAVELSVGAGDVCEGRRRSLRQRIVAATCFLTMFGGIEGPAQAQSDRRPSFEVASVRPTAPQARFSQRITNTRVDITSVSVRELLWMAFEIHPLFEPGRLSAPDWAKDVRVDIHASLPEGSVRQQVPEMLKALLTDRFGLRWRAQPRQTDGFELVVGPSGPKLQDVAPANDLEKAFSEDSTRKTIDQTVGSPDGDVRRIVTSRGLMTITERSLYERTTTDSGAAYIDASRITMPDLADLLSTTLSRPVFDRTQLRGTYRVQVEIPPAAWAVSALNAAGLAAKADGSPLSDPTGVSLEKNLERIGLKLKPIRIQRETILVEHLNKAPTDN